MATSGSDHKRETDRLKRLATNGVIRVTLGASGLKRDADRVMRFVGILRAKQVPRRAIDERLTSWENAQGGSDATR